MNETQGENELLLYAPEMLLEHSRTDNYYKKLVFCSIML